MHFRDRARLASDFRESARACEQWKATQYIGFQTAHFLVAYILVLSIMVLVGAFFALLIFFGFEDDDDELLTIITWEYALSD